MNPQLTCLACLERDPPAAFEAALWVAAEHDPTLQPQQILAEVGGLAQGIGARLPSAPSAELAQPLLRQLGALGFQEAHDLPLRPQAALLHHVLRRRRGQPLSLALLALELARRLAIPLVGVNFPGHFLLRVPGADHLLDPCGGRRLYTHDCREWLTRLGVAQPLSAAHLQVCDARTLLVRLSRNLRQLHQQNDEPLAALKDAERVLRLGGPSVADHLARAELYRQLDCPHAERHDLQHALLLSENEAERLLLGQRLKQLQRRPALH